MGKMMDFLVWLGILKGPEPVFYIGGSDVLPPPLKGADEQEALEALEMGDENAKQRLIEHNLRLVVYIARRFENTGINLEDLISIGTIGLIKAIGTYRLDRNIRLATYASRCIENEILMYIRKIANQKMEISLEEPINMDGEGNELLLSDILGTDEDVVFWHGARLSLKAGEDVAGIPGEKLYIGKKGPKGISWVGGKYADGWVSATISSQGVYDIAVDTIPPVLAPVNEAMWEQNAVVEFRLDDNETKPVSFRGTLNGKFVLFKYNRKERRLTFDFKQENIKSGTHSMKVVATDACGNTAVFEKDVKY